ncbi:DUF1203 domain-containing protein [Naumannella huperziae]
MQTPQLAVTGVDPTTLAELLARGIDHAGAPVEPFADPDGGWPLRCCLADSQPGEEIAIIAFRPFPWVSAYAETGPVVVHADGCPGADGTFPDSFEGRDQVVQAFGDDAGRRHVQVYDRHRLVRAGEGLRTTIEEIIADPRVEFVQARNVLSRCYSFTARRGGADQA